MLIIEKTSSPRNTNSSNIQTELMQEKRKNSILEEQLKELSIKYAKEFALLKTKLTEQNAELIINHENNFPFFVNSCLIYIGEITQHVQIRSKKEVSNKDIGTYRS